MPGGSQRKKSARREWALVFRGCFVGKRARAKARRSSPQSRKTRTQILRKSFAKSFQIVLRGALAERKARFLLYDPHLDAQKAWFLLQGSHIGRLKSLPGVLGATWGDSGGFGGAPGTLREALGELSRPPWSALGRSRTPPGTPRSDQKVSPGGLESIFGSVLFRQSLARRSRDDFRTFLGRSGEARTSFLLRPASVL